MRVKEPGSPGWIELADLIKMACACLSANFFFLLVMALRLMRGVASMCEEMTTTRSNKNKQVRVMMSCLLLFIFCVFVFFCFMIGENVFCFVLFCFVKINK